MKKLLDLAERAWVVIANARNGDWLTETETPEWREAAAKWRDSYHEVLKQFMGVGMSEEKIRSALAACRRSVLINMVGVGERLSDAEMKLLFSRIGHLQARRHVLYMIAEAEKVLTEGEHRREKVMRWLGFIQGCLWCLGYATIEELKDMNRPDEPQREEREESHE